MPDDLTDIEIKLAEADKFRAEAEKFRNDAALTALNAEGQRLYLETARRDHAFADAADIRHRVYRFRGHVDGETVGLAVEHLTRWSRLNPGEDMTVFINSPGGYVHHGMELFDTIVELRAAGHHMTGVGRGYVASMGSILLQAFDQRVMGPECYMLIHQPSGGAQGTLGEIEDTKAWLDMTAERVLNIYADRCASSSADKPFTRLQIKRGWDRHDWWLSSDAALRGGLIDEIR